MKKLIKIAALITIALTFFSCKTLKEIPEDKTSAQIIQMGQNYVGIGDYKSAEFCYNTVIERYGSDSLIYVEGKYELGRVYLAQRKYDKAYSVFTELLDIYDSSYGMMLPGAYKKLCNISISQIPEIKLQEIKAKNTTAAE
jgi:tetratricopeptide (TPR) repeat protein